MSLDIIKHRTSSNIFGKDLWGLGINGTGLYNRIFHFDDYYNLEEKQKKDEWFQEELQEEIVQELWESGQITQEMIDREWETYKSVEFPGPFMQLDLDTGILEQREAPNIYNALDDFRHMSLADAYGIQQKQQPSFVTQAVSAVSSALEPLKEVVKTGGMGTSTVPSIQSSGISAPPAETPPSRSKSPAPESPRSKSPIPKGPVPVSSDEVESKTQLDTTTSSAPVPSHLTNFTVGQVMMPSFASLFKKTDGAPLLPTTTHVVTSRETLKEVTEPTKSEPQTKPITDTSDDPDPTTVTETSDDELDSDMSDDDHSYFNTDDENELEKIRAQDELVQKTRVETSKKTLSDLTDWIKQNKMKFQKQENEIPKTPETSDAESENSDNDVTFDARLKEFQKYANEKFGGASLI